MREYMEIATIKKLMVIGFACLTCLGTAQANEIKIISLRNPVASNGVRIGDILQRVIEVETPEGVQLPKTSLPLKGDNRNGMELRDISVEQFKVNGHQHYLIAMSYQVFANANYPVVMQLPAEHFALTGGAHALSINVPAWHFWYSPLVSAGIKNAKDQLQPQYKAALLDLNVHHNRFVIWLIALIVGALGLIYVNADKRWLPFMGGVFAKAHRRIKQLPKKHATDKVALMYLHQAFNQTYGANLFANEVDVFLERHPKFVKLKAEIHGFFNESNAVLFGQHQKNQALYVSELAKLSKRLRDCERGV